MFNSPSGTVKTRIQENPFSGFRLIGFLYIGYFRWNQPKSVFNFLHLKKCKGFTNYVEIHNFERKLKLRYTALENKYYCICTEILVTTGIRKTPFPYFIRLLLLNIPRRCSNTKVQKPGRAMAAHDLANRESSSQLIVAWSVIHPDWLIRSNFRLRRSDRFA